MTIVEELQTKHKYYNNTQPQRLLTSLKGYSQDLTVAHKP